MYRGQAVGRVESWFGPFISLALAAFALSINPAFADADERLLFPAKFSTYILKAGYDSATDSVKDACISGTDGTNDKTDLDKQGLTSALVFSSVIETKDQLLTKLSGSTDLGFRTFKFGKEGASSLEINDYSAYILLQFEVEKGRRQLQNIELTDRANRLYAGDPKQFRMKCGNEFFVAEFGGGYLYGLLEIQTTTSSEQEDVKTSLGGLFSGITFDTKSKDELKRVLDRKRSRLWILQSGGASIPVLSNSVEDFIKKVEAAAGSIVKSPNARGAYRTWSYDKISHVTNPPLPVIAQTRIENRDDALNAFYRTDRHYRNLRYAVQNPGEFEKHDTSALQKSESKLRGELDALSDYLQACSVDLIRCAKKPPIVSLAVQLPARLRQFADSCYRKRSLACGVESWRLQRSASCGVAQYVSRRDPLCGVEGYLEARSAACGAERYNLGPCVINFIPAVPRTHSAYRPPVEFPCPSGRMEVRTWKDAGASRASVESYVWQAYCNGNPTGQRVSSYVPSGLGNQIYEGQCRAVEFGVELWRLCADIAHGTHYNTCRRSEFGVESYAECRSQDHGVEQYRECLVKVSDGGAEEQCL